MDSDCGALTDAVTSAENVSLVAASVEVIVDDAVRDAL